MSIKSQNIEATGIVNQNGLHSSLEEQDEENIVELQEDWGDDYKDVVTFLCGLHLNDYVEMFVNQGINLDIFLNLNEDDLCHIGMTNSNHRETLLKGTSQLRLNKCKGSSEVQLSNLSSEEVSAILSSTVKHLTVMHAALAHTRLSLRKSSAPNTLVSLSLSSAALLERLALEAQLQAELVNNQTNTLLAMDPKAVNVPKVNWKMNLSVLSSIGIACALLVYMKQRSE